MDFLSYIFIVYSLPALLIAWILDKWLGDPAWLPHPMVGFGKLIAIGEQFLNQGKYKIIKGGILSICLIMAVYFLTLFLLSITYTYSCIIHLLVSAILIFYCLAGTTLIREVKAVFEALEHSLDDGRKQISRIVGRDTGELTEKEVQTAALETLAENLSDGVIAPLFWYLLLGIPGMLAYKMINTLDSMIGYKNERYLLFGKVAAYIDDVANYIPARLTALLMIIVSGKWQLMSFVKKYGKQHASPNSGYPEAALAGILNGRFGGPHLYFGKMVYKPYIGENERSFSSADMQTAIKVNQRVEAIIIVLLLFIAICFHDFGYSVVASLLAA